MNRVRVKQDREGHTVMFAIAIIVAVVAVVIVAVHLFVLRAP